METPTTGSARDVLARIRWVEPFGQYLSISRSDPDMLLPIWWLVQRTFPRRRHAR